MIWTTVPTFLVVIFVTPCSEFSVPEKGQGKPGASAHGAPYVSAPATISVISWVMAP